MNIIIIIKNKVNYQSFNELRQININQSHGLWPTYNATKSYGNFNLQLFINQPKMLDDMQNYWPPKSKNTQTDVFLWKH